MSDNATTPDARAQFLALLAESLQQQSFVKLVLARHVGAEAELQRITAKPLTIKGQPSLSFVYRYKTRDITRNLPLDEALSQIGDWLPGAFRNAHLLSLADEAQLEFSKKGKPMLHRNAAQQARQAAVGEHDREKKRYLELSRPFLHDLGVTDKQQALIPAMSRKWKQINRFI